MCRFSLIVRSSFSFLIARQLTEFSVCVVVNFSLTHSLIRCLFHSFAVLFAYYCIVSWMDNRHLSSFAFKLAVGLVTTFIDTSFCVLFRSFRLIGMAHLEKMYWKMIQTRLIAWHKHNGTQSKEADRVWEKGKDEIESRFDWLFLWHLKNTLHDLFKKNK